MTFGRIFRRIDDLLHAACRLCICLPSIGWCHLSEKSWTLYITNKVKKRDKEDKITESKTAYFRYSNKESGLSEETTQVSIGIEDSHYRVMEPHVAEVPSGG